MDIRTGRTYETKEDAIAAGVPASDIAHITERIAGQPEVRFDSGPFKNRVYKRDPLTGNLVRVNVRATQ
jgi:hypothetical protein